MQFSISFVVERASAGGTYTNGRFVPPAVTEITMQGSIQPILPGEATQMNPEGTMPLERIKIYSDGPLYPDIEVEGRIADVVQYNGKRYKVDRSADYSKLPTPLRHYRSEAVIINA